MWKEAFLEFPPITFHSSSSFFNLFFFFLRNPYLMVYVTRTVTTNIERNFQFTNSKKSTFCMSRKFFHSYCFLFFILLLTLSFSHSIQFTSYSFFIFCFLRLIYRTASILICQVFSFFFFYEFISEFFFKYFFYSVVMSLNSWSKIR